MSGALQWGRAGSEPGQFDFGGGLTSDDHAGSIAVDESKIPEDVSRLDKNASFRSHSGDMPVHLAHLIRDAAEHADVQTI